MSSSEVSYPQLSPTAQPTQPSQPSFDDELVDVESLATLVELRKDTKGHEKGYTDLAISFHINTLLRRGKSQPLTPVLNKSVFCSRSSGLAAAWRSKSWTYQNSSALLIYGSMHSLSAGDLPVLAIEDSITS